MGVLTGGELGHGHTGEGPVCKPRTLKEASPYQTLRGQAGWPPGPSEGPVGTSILDFWLQNCESMNFCCLMPPGWRSFVTGNKKPAHLPPPTLPGPRRRPPRATAHHSPLLGQTPTGAAYPSSSPWPGREQASVVPKAQPHPRAESLPVLPPPKANGGPQGCSHWEHQEEKGNVFWPVSHSFRNQHWARGPEPRPTQCPWAALGTPSPATHPLPGLPQPCPKPKLPSAGPTGAHGGARKLCGRGSCGRG